MWDFYLNSKLINYVRKVFIMYINMKGRNIGCMENRYCRMLNF